MIKNSQRKTLIIRRVLFLLLIMFLAFLQNGSGRFPQIFGARAFLLIPVVTAIGMYEKETSGVLFGLFAGLLWDVVAKGNNFNAMFLVCAGFASAILIKTIMRNNIMTHLIISGSFALLYSLIYWFYHYIIINLDRAAIMLLKFYIPSAIYTALMAIPVFLIVKAIENLTVTSDYVFES